MQAILFVPGIMGSRLSLRGQEVWPPTPVEAVRGYRRIVALADPAVRPTAVIDRVACLPVYGPILDDLRDIASGTAGVPKASFIAFPYDWRRDLREAAESLATLVEEVMEEGSDEIVLVAHSMGGLVARWFLESGGFEDRPGWRAVTRLIALAVPHAGAPVAVSRALGLESTAGLSGPDTARLAADARYPSLYQLFPDRDVVAALAWQGSVSQITDLYDPATARALGLSLDNLQAAQDFRAGLGPSRRPGHVQYDGVVATGHRTCTRVELRGGRPDLAVRDVDAGDGAVPIWSAALLTAPHAFTPGEHNKVLRERDFRDHLYRLFGATPRVAPFSASDGRAALSISLDRLVYAAGEPMDLVLIAPMPAARLEVRITLDLIDEEGRAVQTQPDLGAVAWSGAAVGQLRLTVNAPDAPGRYRLGIDGPTHTTLTDNDVAPFLVSEGV
ncbi:hypothetical protein [Brevundimonas sp. LM2]|uniref:lipase family alpha/beta hydrolase n=1 Tax=Brevundimonas sp. LM2 TaxID=1938605 RepID=UPI0012378E0E|nr:hypothetical protein [Brevundimonas sp. LM2]